MKSLEAQLGTLLLEVRLHSPWAGRGGGGVAAGDQPALPAAIWLSRQGGHCSGCSQATLVSRSGELTGLNFTRAGVGGISP